MYIDVVTTNGNATITKIINKIINKGIKTAVIINDMAFRKKYLHESVICCPPIWRIFSIVLKAIAYFFCKI
jgi:hypothetical protein